MGFLYRMGECSLDHFAGCVRPFRGPVPEARPEPMRHGGDAEFLGQSRERHGGEWLPAQTAEHEAGAIAQFLYVVKDRERPARERDAVNGLANRRLQPLGHLTGWQERAGRSNPTIPHHSPFDNNAGSAAQDERERRRRSPFDSNTGSAAQDEHERPRGVRGAAPSKE